MTEIAQQRAMAKACGKAMSCADDPYMDTPELHHEWNEWKTQDKPFPFRFRKCKKCPAVHIEGEAFVQFDSDHVAPNYNTLDAMHEAENILLNAQRRYYMLHLNATHPLQPMNFLKHEEDVTMHVFLLCNATAAQRREAFLKTLGLWVTS